MVNTSTPIQSSYGVISFNFDGGYNDALSQLIDEHAKNLKKDGGGSDNGHYEIITGNYGMKFQDFGNSSTVSVQIVLNYEGKAKVHGEYTGTVNVTGIDWNGISVPYTTNGNEYTISIANNTTLTDHEATINICPLTLHISEKNNVRIDTYEIKVVATTSSGYSSTYSYAIPTS